MKKSVSVRLLAVTALSMSLALLAAGTASSGARFETAVPTPHKFTTVPFKSSLQPGGQAGVLRVARDFPAIAKSGAQSEISNAVDPTNWRHQLVQCNDLSNFSSYNCLYESSDRGQTWAQSAGFNVNTFCYDPWVRFGRDGDAFVAYECSDQRVAYRNAGSATWNHFTLQNSSLFPDRDALVVDNNPSSPRVDSVYIGYDEANVNNAAHVWYSLDGKGGWVKSPKINDVSRTIGVNPATAPDGDVYATWLDFDGKKITMDVSHNGGATWGTDRVVTNMRLNTPQFFICIPPQPDRCVVPMPFTAVDNSGGPFDGRLYVTYPDKDPVAADWNVYVRWSDDDGATWSAETKVNNDTGGYQFFPSISVGADGTVAIGFYDTRDDNTNDEKVHRYWSWSTNGGVTWAANERITRAQSDESGFGDPNDYGDYESTDTGTTPTGATFFQHAWTDSRPGTQGEDVWTASSKA